MESQAFSHSPPARALRFTILRHERPADTHWDLLLELPGQDPLLTWQVHAPPDQWPGRTIAARRLPDHRRIYLDYEGPIADTRGAVTQADTGELDLTLFTPAKARFTLRGKRLLATVHATHTSEDLWQLAVSALAPSSPPPSP